MALLELPITNEKYNYKFDIVLEGKKYFFSFNYNNRIDAWFMDIADEVESPIVEGLMLFLGLDLLEQYADERLPQGNLFIVNNKEEFIEPTEENFGVDVKLYYNEVE